jgi:hypothetical protein
VRGRNSPQIIRFEKWVALQAKNADSPKFFTVSTEFSTGGSIKNCSAQKKLG